mmetsp:Transcript_53144/g.140377  ORF Transcript_53144/g.140377 Transcript_53144/m.140377 type:complete len:283 (+) Transcript_53144:1432-2280(+)
MLHLKMRIDQPRVCSKFLFQHMPLTRAVESLDLLWLQTAQMFHCRNQSAVKLLAEHMAAHHRLPIQRKEALQWTRWSALQERLGKQGLIFQVAHTICRRSTLLIWQMFHLDIVSRKHFLMMNCKSLYCIKYKHWTLTLLMQMHTSQQHKHYSKESLGCLSMFQAYIPNKLRLLCESMNQLNKIDIPLRMLPLRCWRMFQLHNHCSWTGPMCCRSSQHSRARRRMFLSLPGRNQWHTACRHLLLLRCWRMFQLHNHCSWTGPMCCRSSQHSRACRRMFLVRMK